ncbi:CHAT domain-containing protein, partial [Nostoc sp. 2RC]|uniref:CHAT domain-containing tetratricopeptide repeat protein n=1 Tax=Nostoc sp. 2RC TaxID=2485484 RepID=UPI001629F8CF
AALEVRTKSDFPEQWASTQNNLGNAYLYRISGNRAENIELAIATCKKALEVLNPTAFAEQWAMTQNNLGNAYSDRILGERTDNIELAIATYKKALEVLNFTAFGEQWATTQNNLGNAYLYRISGNRAENIELAIAIYKEVLKVLNFTAFPEQWATTQNNLGNAYTERILGDTDDNLESAIAAYKAALEIRTKSGFPISWATTQNNLGIAYLYRISGERGENIELAIAAYKAALEIRTKSAFPINWATTQNNLGIAYLYRISGERGENIESAIAAYKAALEVYTKRDFCEQWATTQNNLGIAYTERISGERGENLEKAIAAYKAALKVRTKSDFPEQWASTQNNLGNAYLYRILGERGENQEKAIAAYSAPLEIRTNNAFAINWTTTQNNLGIRISKKLGKNLEKAIAAYKAALEVRTKSDFPEQWASTQNNLGNAYLYRISGERADNIELAIAAYSAALEVLTRSTFPVDWADTQNNLGNAYRNRILGKRGENIKLAISAYKAALEVLTPSDFPQNHAETVLNLGRLYQDEKQFYSAYNTFFAAIETVEALPGEIVSGEEVKRKQAEQWNQLYRRMIEVCLKLKKDTEAIEYIERSKTRNLVELLIKASTSPENLPLDGSINFEEIKNFLDNKTAIIKWYIFDNCFRTFIITHDNNNPRIWHSTRQDLDDLINWTNNYLNDYYNPEDRDKIQWREQLGERLEQLAEILHIDEILDQVPEQCQRLILIPHRYLHLFPLHALPARQRYLIDLFNNGVGYAPSYRILRELERRQRSDFQSFFAIQNPTEDLYQDYEKDLGAVAAIKKQFTQRQILKQDKANKSAIVCVDENSPNVTLHPELVTANCVFFFCHGYFKSDYPEDSGLLLADCFVDSELVQVDSKRYMHVFEDKVVDLTKCLTLKDIITHFQLENCRLVTLSACETGLTDFTSTSDEYIGLPSGFLLAGSTNVVSSLWTVSATATALLMIKFYAELKQQQNNIVLALKTAQCWLRDTTVEDFQNWLNNSSLSLVWQVELNKYFANNYQNASTKPFESPFYWAAFCTIGKGV